MSGPCLCPWCVEARQRARDAETAGLRDLAAYDQARLVSSAYTLRARVAGERAREMREARERAGATCP